MERKSVSAPSRRGRELPPKQRAKVTNGAPPRLGDGRSARARRHRDLLASYEALVPVDQLTSLKRSLCGQAAALALALQDQQSRIAAGVECDLDSLVRGTGLLMRIEKLLAPPPSSRSAMVRPGEPLPAHERGSLEEFIAEKFGASTRHPSLYADQDAAPADDDGDDAGSDDPNDADPEELDPTEEPDG